MRLVGRLRRLVPRQRQGRVLVDDLGSRLLLRVPGCRRIAGAGRDDRWWAGRELAWRFPHVPPLSANHMRFGSAMSQIPAQVTQPDHIPPVRTRPVIHATPGVPLTHVLQPHENPTPVRILRRTPVRPPRRDRVRGRHRSRRRDARLPGRGVFATCATPSHRTSTTRLSGNTAPRTSSPQWDKRSCCIRGSSGHNESTPEPAAYARPRM